MKRVLLVLLLLVCSSQFLFATEYVGDVTIETQQDLIDFYAGGYTSITGNLTVDGTSLTNLNGLIDLTSVGGNVSINGNDYLTILEGLMNLTNVGGDLYIDSNSSLIDLEGLENVSSVGGLIIAYNSSLSSLSALENLTSVSNGNLNIISNGVLTSLEGLDNITSIGGSLQITESDALENITALGRVTSIGGDIRIDCNEVLTSLEGINYIRSFDGDLFIVENASLESIESLFNIRSVNILAIGFNPALTSLKGLHNITSVNNSIYIVANDLLTDLSGLNSIQSVIGDLWIGDNVSLIRLGAPLPTGGLINLETISGRLLIENNDALRILRLSKLGEVGSDFTIDTNPELCLSLARKLRNQVLDLNGIGGSITISGNKDSCSGLAPDPMLFDIDPMIMAFSAIQMTAAEAYDPDGGVEYNIDETSGIHDDLDTGWVGNDPQGGWQGAYPEVPARARMYIVNADRLEPLTEYCFRIKARNDFDEETDWSEEVCVTTDSKVGCGASPMFSDGSDSDNYKAMLPLAATLLLLAFWGIFRGMNFKKNEI